MKQLINKKTKKVTIISDEKADVIINSEVAHLFVIKDIETPKEVIEHREIEIPEEVIEKEKPKKKKETEKKSYRSR